MRFLCTADSRSEQMLVTYDQFSSISQSVNQIYSPHTHTHHKQNNK